MEISQYSIEDFVCDEGFQSYCTGENPAQVLFWEEYAAAHPAQQADMETARQLVSVLNARQGNRLEQLQQLRLGMAQSAKLQSLLNTMTAPENAQPTGFTTRKRKHVLYIAATAAVLAAGIIVLSLLSPTPSQPVANRNTTTTFAAGNAPRKTVVLPDGTVITLRRQSKAVLDTGFNQSNRTLTLEGEAFFDVKHEATRPFIVHTQQAAITVLGTQFNVSAWPGKGATETALFRGQVSVQANGGATVVLAPNEKLVVENTPSSPARQTASQPMKVSQLNTAAAGKGAAENAWVHSRLEIENEPLKDIAAKLEKWYGIPIVFADGEVQLYRYSGTFESESIVEALKALQLSYAFDFKMENGKIIIRK